MSGHLPLIAVLLVLLPLATHRVTRFITRDRFPLMHVPREAFVQRWGVYENAADKRTSLNGKSTNIVMRSLAYLWECDWCTSVWVAAALSWLTWNHLETMTWVMAALAASDVTGLLAQHEPE